MEVSILCVRLLLVYRSSHAMHIGKYFLKRNISWLGNTAELVVGKVVKSQQIKCEYVGLHIVLGRGQRGEFRLIRPQKVKNGKVRLLARLPWSHMTNLQYLHWIYIQLWPLNSRNITLTTLQHVFLIGASQISRHTLV